MKRAQQFFRALFSLTAPLLFTPLSIQGDILGMNQAFQRVIDNSPELRAHWAEVWVQEGLTTQAGLYPNPSLAFELEDFGGTKRFKNMQHAETTVAIAQVFELGGKRARRASLAEAKRDAAFWDAQIKLLDLCQTLYQTFARAALAQEHYCLSQKRLKIAQQSHDLISERYKSGKETLLQQRKALSAKHINAITLQDKELDVGQTLTQIALLWGSNCPDFDGIDFNLYTLIPPPPLYVLKEQLCNSPDLLRLEQLSWAARNEIALQRALAIPNLEAYAGIKYHNEEKAYRCVVGGAIEIPIRNRNQGNIASAHAALGKVQWEENQLLLKLQADLTLAHQKWQLAYQKATALKEHIEELEETVCLMNESFSEGKLPYSEVVIAQTELFDRQEDWMDELFEIHLRQSEVKRLLGQVCLSEETLCHFVAN